MVDQRATKRFLLFLYYHVECKIGIILFEIKTIFTLAAVVPDMTFQILQLQNTILMVQHV